jgi:putative ABC transport system permease protein
MNKRLLVAGSVRALTRYKLRSFLMSLGIVIGVAALVVMRSMGSGAEQKLLDKLDRIFGASSIIVVNNGGGIRGGEREQGKLRIDDIEAIQVELEQVTEWDPLIMVGRSEVVYRDRNRGLRIAGHSERADVVWGRGVTRGEFFSESDVRSAARVALIGHRAAEALFDDEDPLGKTVRIDNAPFRIKGVLEPYGVDPHGLDRDDEIHVPVTTVQRRLAKTEFIGSAKMLVADPERLDETVEQVADLLHARHGLAPHEPEDFALYTPTQVQRIVRKANRVVTVYLPATAGIALLVAAVVIANIMLIAVRERVGEIGLRKAVGATDRQIVGQFLLESLVVTLVSGLAGAGLGAGLLTLASRSHEDVSLAPDSIVVGVLAALVVGVLAGLLPARRAARLEPVDALR